MKDDLTEIKLAITGVFATITAWMGAVAWPVYMLVLLGIMDYATGMAAAPHRGQQRQSKVAFSGIVKKVCILLLVALGGVLDWLVRYATETVGIQLPVNFLVAALVAVWLICNEIISILENIGDIGVRMPPMLLKAVKWVQRGAEEKADQAIPGVEQNE